MSVFCLDIEIFGSPIRDGWSRRLTILTGFLLKLIIASRPIREPVRLSLPEEPAAARQIRFCNENSLIQLPTAHVVW
jgi:hypothetical protein